MKRWLIAAATTFIFAGNASVIAAPTNHRAFPNVESTLARGEVSISYRHEGDIQYVTGSIRIPHAAEKVWPILANPYEFEEKICPHFKMLEVLVDKPGMTLLKCQVDIGLFLPAVKYTVESRYENGQRISFKSKAGDLKDFRGYWEVIPVNDGRECDVTYSMYVVPGIPVPQWLVRQGVKIELPHTLTALRNRIHDVYESRNALVKRSLAASGRVI